MFDTKKFIGIIKNNPGLYDNSSPGFKQVEDKQNVWEKISVEMGNKLDANTLKKRFRTLRERYTRELRKNYLDPSVPVTYEYFEPLSFLSEFIKFRSISIENSSRKSIISKKPDKVEVEEDSSYIVTEIADPQYLRDNNQIIFETALDVQVEQNLENEPLPIQQNQQIHQDDSFDDANAFKKTSEADSDQGVPPAKRKCMNISTTDQQQHQDGVLDGNDFFGKSIAISLRQLTRLNNIRAKTEICKVLEKFIMMEEDS
ncbi:unnamed protein product [Diamesa tonsa]